MTNQEIHPSLDLSEDTLGGYHPDPALRKWSAGSCWESEGLYLYKTVRELRPAVIVEVGRWEGCSTSHLALACKHNDFGKVYSIDINAGAGQKIPEDLRPWIQFVNRDVFSLDRAKLLGDKKIDLLLEDGQHTWGMTQHVLLNFPVRPGGRIIVHDWFHWDCQKTTRAEAQKVLGDPDETFIEPPSDCGYAIWHR